MLILVTTMGTTWAVVPELYGFTNPQAFPFYANHPDHDLFAAWRADSLHPCAAAPLFGN
jgi:adenosine deaminase